MNTIAMNPAVVDHILMLELPELKEQHQELKREMRNGTIYGEAYDQESKLLNDLIDEKESN